MNRTLLVLAAAALAGCGGSKRSAPAGISDLIASLQPESQTYEGPDHVKIDLLRTTEGGPRIYVQALLPDGRPGLFMIDTGADVNVMNEDTAARLGLEVEEGVYRLSGLSGSTRAGQVTVPDVHLGEAHLTDVEFAVGVRGVSTRARSMPLDGILGMDVWHRFIMELDYPADVLVLHRPGTKKLPKTAAPLYFDGHAIEAVIEVETGGDVPVTDTISLQVDTGASALLLAGNSGMPFAAAATDGVEPVYGVGASEYMPPSQFLEQTRRVPVVAYTLGGRRNEQELNAQWLYWEPSQRRHVQTPGLIGHDLLAGNRVFIDAQGGQIALPRSHRRHTLNNGHAVLLAQDIERYGADAPERDLFRARMNEALGEWDETVRLLSRYVEHHPDDVEGRVMLARARRIDADLPGAWTVLQGLGPGQLVDQSEIVASVNGLALEGRTDEALALGRRSVAERGEEAEARVALADAYLADGQTASAREQLLEAARLTQNPDAFLLRRARVAMAEGDRFGALALVRRQVQLYPTEGKFLWYYAMLVETPQEEATLRRDLEQAVGRLHKELRPLDFMVAAYHAIGDDKLASAYMQEGIARDCEAMDRFPAARDNCTAWYRGLAGDRLDAALALVDGALAETGPRPDYLDTKAVVHLARGELDLAFDAAIHAARLSPDDVYMLWQAERIKAMKRQSGVSMAD